MSKNPLHKSGDHSDTNHMLLEARLVAGSKLTSDISHPPASYKEGVSFPGGTQQKERDAESVHGNHKHRVASSVGVISLNYMFICGELDGFDNIAVFI